jgi:hypothetical protein
VKQSKEYAQPLRRGSGDSMYTRKRPRFESALGRRQLRILNAIFLGVVRAGGKGQVGGGDRLKTSIVVHGSTVGFRLTAVVPEAKKSKRGASPAVDRSDRLRLSILDVHGSKPERFAWVNGEEHPLETQITDIAVELVTTAEINYRDACLRRHLWIAEQRETLRQHLRAALIEQDVRLRSIHCPRHHINAA